MLYIRRFFTQLLPETRQFQWKLVEPAVPQQSNAVDCGMFTGLFALTIASQLLTRPTGVGSAAVIEGIRIAVCTCPVFSQVDVCVMKFDFDQSYIDQARYQLLLILLTCCQFPSLAAELAPFLSSLKQQALKGPEVLA